MCGSDHLCSMPNVACESRQEPIDAPEGHDIDAAEIDASHGGGHMDAGDDDDDAGGGKHDAGPIDAPPPIDAAPVDAPPDAPAVDAPPPTVKLHVKIDGPDGSVKLDTGATCDDDCTFDVDQGVALTLTAIDGEDTQLDHWMGACTGNNMHCMLTPTAPMTDVHCKFKKQ